MTNIQLIKSFFSEVELAEMKALTKDERKELAEGIAQELGLKWNGDKWFPGYLG